MIGKVLAIYNVECVSQDIVICPWLRYQYISYIAVRSASSKTQTPNALALIMFIDIANAQKDPESYAVAYQFEFLTPQYRL